MALTSSKFNFLIPLFFLFCIFYWFPFLSNYLVSLVKIFILFFLIIIKFSFVRKVNFKKFILELALIFFSFVYEIFSGGSGIFLLTIIIFMVFYELGVNSKFIKIHNLYFIFAVIAFTWVFLSFFFPFLNYKNELFLDYEYRDIMLSSTGFSIARTSWGISVVLLTLFFLQFSKNKKLKTILLLSAFLCIITTGSRTALICLFLSLIFMTVFTINSKVLKIFLLTINFFAFLILYIVMGQFLRLAGEGDFSNGRLEIYTLLDQLYSDNIILGWYAYGGYDLKNYGFSVSQFHNAWIHFFLEYGFFGISVFLTWFIYCLLSLSFKNFKEKIFLFLILICGFITTFLEPETVFSYGYHILIFWYTLGLLSKSNIQNKGIL